MTIQNTTSARAEVAATPRLSRRRAFCIKCLTACATTVVMTVPLAAVRAWAQGFSCG